MAFVACEWNALYEACYVEFVSSDLSWKKQALTPSEHSPAETSVKTRTPGGFIMFRSSQAVSHGISFGTAMAIAISWSVNKSILWAIVHGFFSWLYVIYYALIR